MQPLGYVLIIISITSAANLENLLIKFGGEIKSQWYTFGETIGVPREYLDTLSGGDELQCLRNVLDHWLRHHPGQPMTKEVVKAQKKIRFQNQFEQKGIVK